MPNLNTPTAPLYYVPSGYMIQNVPQVPLNTQTGQPNLIRNDDPPSYEVACGSGYLHNK